MSKTTEVGGHGFPAVPSFPGSQKVYVEDSREDLRVPVREIKLSPSSSAYGEEENAPVRVYDTRGPYTDPSCCITPARKSSPLRSDYRYRARL
jgi:phosphomethylpyrimidine synthase